MAAPPAGKADNKLTKGIAEPRKKPKKSRKDQPPAQ